MYRSPASRVTIMDGEKATLSLLPPCESSMHGVQVLPARLCALGMVLLLLDLLMGGVQHAAIGLVGGTAWSKVVAWPENEPWAARALPERAFGLGWAVMCAAVPEGAMRGLHALNRLPRRLNPATPEGGCTCGIGRRLRADRTESPCTDCAAASDADAADCMPAAKARMAVRFVRKGLPAAA
jgi:hypothetical protein